MATLALAPGITASAVADDAASRPTIVLVHGAWADSSSWSAFTGAPSGPVGWHTLPCWYAVFGQNRMIDPAEEAHMAARAGCHTITFADASHVGGITNHADQFVQSVEHAAGQ